MTKEARKYLPVEEKLASLTKEEVLHRLDSLPGNYAHLPKEIKEDIDVAMKACLCYINNFEEVPNKLRSSKTFCTELLQSILDSNIFVSGDSYENLVDKMMSSSKIKKDFDCCLALFQFAVKNKLPLPIVDFDDSLRNNFDFAKKLISLDSSSFKTLGDEVHANVKLATMACLKDPFCYSYADDSIRNDGSLLRSVYEKSIGVFFQTVFVNDGSDEQAAINIEIMGTVSSKKDFYVKHFQKEEALIKRQEKDYGISSGIWKVHQNAVNYIVERLSVDELDKVVPSTDMGREAIAKRKVRIIDKETIKNNNSSTKRRKLGF